MFFKEDNFRAMLRFSLPLILSSLSYTIMIFCDRFFLLHYSVDALNSAVVASSLAWPFIEIFRILAANSEVFVAQYFGKKFQMDLCKPTWQMLWLSMGSILIYLPLAYFGAPLMFSNPMEKLYFAIIIYGGFLHPLSATFSAYFIGQGLTRKVMYIAGFSNLLNILLDKILIFGIDGYFPPMGVKGAAIATNIGLLSQVLILALLFFSKRNRQHYGTAKWHFDFKLLMSCVRLGFPMSLTIALNFLACGLFYKVMAGINAQYITIISIWDTVIYIFCFFSAGINEAATIMAGHYAGAKNHLMIPRLVKAGLKVFLIPTCLAALLLIIAPDYIINLFLHTGTHQKILLGEDGMFSVSPGILRSCLALEFFFLLFSWMQSLFEGILTGVGDTFFQIVASPLLNWFCLLFPMYFLMIKQSGSINVALSILVFQSLGTALVFFLRYHFGKWKKIYLLN